MSRKIVISFPGGRGNEVPLLYFGAKHFENQGYEKLFVNHPLSGEDDFEAIYENAKRTLDKVTFGEYEQVVFVAKSLGTVVACRLKEELQIPAELILFTPLEETLPYIRATNQIRLVAAGETDRFLESARLQEFCEKEGIPYYIEPGVGHRMEIKGNLERDLEILGNVLRCMQTVTMENMTQNDD